MKLSDNGRSLLITFFGMKIDDPVYLDFMDSHEK